MAEANWVCFVKPRGQSTFCQARTVPNKLGFSVGKPLKDALLRPSRTRRSLPHGMIGGIEETQLRVQKNYAALLRSVAGA